MADLWPTPITQNPVEVAPAEDDWRLNPESDLTDVPAYCRFSGD